MSLKEKLLKYDAKELIFVVEPHSDFTDEAKNIALDIIRSNKEINFKAEAKNYWKQHIQKNIKSILKSKKIPLSCFIVDKEMKLILEDCFEEWKEEQDLFGIDTTKYWVV
jgi:hypothetical protein